MITQERYKELLKKTETLVDSFTQEIKEIEKEAGKLISIDITIPETWNNIFVYGAEKRTSSQGKYHSTFDEMTISVYGQSEHYPNHILNNNGDVELGLCDICKQEAVIYRKYYHYDIKCNCHSPNHFELVRHCYTCKPSPPSTTNIVIPPNTEN